MMQKLTKVLFISVIKIVFMTVFYASTDVALAQEGPFPSKPINLIIGAAPGASTEVPARALAKATEKILGQPIVCSNTPGVAAARALGQVLKAKPDGYM